MCGRIALPPLVLALGLLVAGVACGGDDDKAVRQPSTPSPRFTNPVYEEDFPDPFVLRVDGTYYAYGTNGDGMNVRTLRSPDLVRWKAGKDALPELGSWAFTGRTWAPEVLRRGDGNFVLYYTALSSRLSSQCIGAAIASSPRGPFVDRGKQPLVCQKAEGGSIDASPFRDRDGALYLLWKNDGNCCGVDTFIYAQRLSANGLKLLGRRTRLVKQDAKWEGQLVEAPTLWRQGGRYYLFFSANAFDSALYAVGYARCKGPLGPCTDAPGNPILDAACEAAGPGHQTIVRDDDGETWMVYHAWPPHAVGSVFPGRVLWIDRLEWRNGTPVVRGPTCRPQPVP
jgi:beta-xylosidase